MSNLKSFFGIGTLYSILGPVMFMSAIALSALDCLHWGSIINETVPFVFIMLGAVGLFITIVGLLMVQWVIELERLASPEKKIEP